MISFFSNSILFTTMRWRWTHLTSIHFLVTIFTVTFTLFIFRVILTLAFQVLFLKLRNLLRKSVQLILREKITMNKLIRSPWCFKVLVVHMAPSCRVYTSVIHIFVPLKLIQSFKHQLSVLSTYSRKPVQEILIDISLSQKLRKVSHFII